MRDHPAWRELYETPPGSHPDQLPAVTPGRLLAAHEETMRTHPDPEALQAAWDADVKAAGGIEAMARQWTTANRVQAFSAWLRAGCTGNQGKPAEPEPDVERLRQLIAEYPELARQVITDIAPGWENGE